MEKRFFKNLVITGFIKSLTLSVTGMIDCAFVGRYLGADGLSALKLALPVYSLLSLFSFIFSSGLSIVISKELILSGESRANMIFRSVFTVTCAAGSCLTVLGIFYPAVLTEVFAGSSDPSVKVLTAAYLRPILIGALPIFLYDVLGTIAMMGGAARYLKLSSVSLFAVDIAGDLLAVYLKKGMSGIAFASSASYAAALIMILLYFFSKRSMFRLGFCRPDPAAIRRIILLGSPVGIALICNILRPLSVNRFILSYGTNTGLAALSIQDAVRYVPGALCTGIANATLILTGLFAAEYDHESLKKENESITRWSYLGGTAVAAVLMLLSSWLLWIFTDDPEIHSLGVSALLMYLPGVPFIAINSAIISYYQGLGERRGAAAFAVFDRLAAPVFFAWILGRHFGNLGIYASFAVSEIFVTVTLTAFLLIKRRRTQTIFSGDFLSGGIAADLRMNIGDPEQAVSASRQVNVLCLENGFSQKQAFFTALTVEELAMNSLVHGFDDHKEHHLELRTIITQDSLIIRLRDDGRPFDLTERYKMINPDDPTKNIGLRIIFASADEVNYHSSMDLNNVFIRIRKSTE